MERLADVFGAVVFVVVLILLVGLVTAVAPKPVERVAAKAAGDPWRSLLAGLLIAVLFIPVIVLLAISIIGCPVAIVVLVLAPIVVLFALTSVSVSVGRWLEGRFGWRLKGLFPPALVGVTALSIWNLLAEGLGAVGGVLWVPAAFLWVLGWTVVFVALLIGLGAVWLTRFGAGPAAAPAALPPPPPGGLAEPLATPPTAPAPPPVRGDSIFDEPEPPAPAAAADEPAHEPDPGPRERS
jgi:hypothetical protein